MPLFYLWRLFGSYAWSRLYLRWVGFVAGLRIRVVGTPLRRDTLFLANHLSWLDIMLVASTTGAALVAKDEIARWPVVGWLSRMHRTVFVARAERSGVKAQADALRSSLAGGLLVALFPEGTTSDGVALLPFRASLIAAVFPPLPRLRVQPVALDYGGAAPDIAWAGPERAKTNVRRLLSRKGRIPVTVHFLAPIDPAEAGDRKRLAALSRARILAALHPSASGSDRL